MHRPLIRTFWDTLISVIAGRFYLTFTQSYLAIALLTRGLDWRKGQAWAGDILLSAPESVGLEYAKSTRKY